MIADPSTPTRRDLIAVGCISGTLLMTELALTRIFSVMMFYHFAFLAISIALFGLSASGVFAYLWRARLGAQPPARLLARQCLVYQFQVAFGRSMPAGIRLLRDRAPQMLTWAWGMNGALSVVGATLAIFIAMNWGFQGPCSHPPPHTSSV